MRSNYSTIHQWVGLSEGGYVNHPRDPGGATNHGVTQATFNAWRQSQRKPTDDVRNLTKDEAKRIIERNYFDKVGADVLPAGLDYTVADYGVNSGVSRGVKVLQRKLNALFDADLRVDGVFGDKTLAATTELTSSEIERLIVAINGERMDFLRGLSHWDAFGKGWSKRVMGQIDGLQLDDIGVLDRSVMLLRAETNIPAPVGPNPGKAPDPAEEPGLGENVSEMLGVLRRLLAGGTVPASPTSGGSRMNTKVNKAIVAIIGGAIVLLNQFTPINFGPVSEEAISAFVSIATPALVYFIPNRST